MTIMGSPRDRCRLCFSLLGRDRSICCQKSYHLFKPIERRKFPVTKINSYSIHIRNRTVCFHDLIRRYLHTPVHPLRNSSNSICFDCSRVLLDIEQCAKHLRETIKQLKAKLTKSTRLHTSSLSATFQKRNQSEQLLPLPPEEHLSVSNSDSADEFDDLYDEEELDEDVNDPKNRSSTQTKSSSSQLMSSGGDASSRTPTSKLINDAHNHEADDDDDDDGGDEVDEDEDEDGLIKSSKEEHHQYQPIHSSLLGKQQSKNTRTPLVNSNGFLPTTNKNMSIMDQNNANMMQAHIAQIIASSNPGQFSNDQNSIDPTMNALAQLHRNFLLQIFNDPVAAQAATVAAAAMSATPVKTNVASTPFLSSKINIENKQSGSGRKRKSTPEKRVITNHRPMSNNGDTSPMTDQEAHDSSTPNNGSTDHVLGLSLKGHSRSNQLTVSPAKSTSTIHNLMTNSMLNNGVSSYHQPSTDDDRHESVTMNDSPLTLSPSLIRRTATSKRSKSQMNSPFDNSKLTTFQTNELLSPNHSSTTNEEMSSSNPTKSHRKLDPQSCAECGKVLFTDKTLLLHCQTHAKNEKQCWICNVYDDDIRKHILSEHGNQKFSSAGFKCQHCEKMFTIFSDLEAHTREHSKKKPFECSICHKRFGQQGNLSCHLRIHSGVKPFNCASCGKAFRHSNSLRRHARTVHSASRGLSLSPGSMATTTSSFPLATASTSNSMVSSGNNVHHLNTSEGYEDGPSGLLIASDEGESLPEPTSPSTGDAPSPLTSNMPMDDDSPEQSGTD